MIYSPSLSHPPKNQLFEILSPIEDNMLYGSKLAKSLSSVIKYHGSIDLSIAKEIWILKLWQKSHTLRVSLKKYGKSPQ